MYQRVETISKQLWNCERLENTNAQSVTNKEEWVTRPRTKKIKNRQGQRQFIKERPDEMLKYSQRNFKGKQNWIDIGHSINRLNPSAFNSNYSNILKANWL